MLQQSSRGIGIVSLVPMNGWNANIVYEKLNIVTHKNSTFIAKQKNRGIEPFVSSNWEDIWMPLISGVGIATAVVEYASTKITSPAPPESGWAEEMPELKPAVDARYDYLHGRQKDDFLFRRRGRCTRQDERP